MLYFFTTGTRTPLIALLALRRPKNLVPILFAYAGLGLVAVIVRDPAAAIFALAPAPLVGPALARFARAREETVGALVTGTIGLSFPLLIAAIPGVGALPDQMPLPLGPNVNIALFAFVIGAALASSVPLFRDAILPIVDGARYVALAAILGATAVTAVAFVDLRSVGVAALMLLVGTVCAAIGAILFGGDGIAAALGAGTRDPAVTAAFAISAGLAGGAAVPLAYTALLVLSLGVGKLLIARQA